MKKYAVIEAGNDYNGHCDRIIKIFDNLDDLNIWTEIEGVNYIGDDIYTDVYDSDFDPFIHSVTIPFWPPVNGFIPKKYLIDLKTQIRRVICLFVSVTAFVLFYYFVLCFPLPITLHNIIM